MLLTDEQKNTALKEHGALTEPLVERSVELSRALAERSQSEIALRELSQSDFALRELCERSANSQRLCAPQDSKTGNLCKTVTTARPVRGVRLRLLLSRYLFAQVPVFDFVRSKNSNALCTPGERLL